MQRYAHTVRFGTRIYNKNTSCRSAAFSWRSQVLQSEMIQTIPNENCNLFLIDRTLEQLPDESLVK